MGKFVCGKNKKLSSWYRKGRSNIRSLETVLHIGGGGYADVPVVDKLAYVHVNVCCVCCVVCCVLCVVCCVVNK